MVQTLTSPLPAAPEVTYTGWRDHLQACLVTWVECPHCRSVTDPRKSLHCRWCCETFATPAAAKAHGRVRSCLEPESVGLESRDGRWHAPRSRGDGRGLGRIGTYFRMLASRERGRMTGDQRAAYAAELQAAHESEERPKPMGLLPSAIVAGARWSAERVWGPEALEGIPVPVPLPEVEAGFVAGDTDGFFDVTTTFVGLDDEAEREEREEASRGIGARPDGHGPDAADHDDANPAPADDEARRTVAFVLGA